MPEIPQAALQARQMYLARAPIIEILGKTGFTHDQLYFWLDGAPQPDRTTLLPPIPRRRVSVRRSKRAATRIALVTRLMRATELQVHEIEQRLGGEASEPTASERDARALAVLAKTMRELIALDELNQGPRDAPGSSNDDPVPLDIEELRRSLSQKLESLVAEQQGALSGVADD